MSFLFKFVFRVYFWESKTSRNCLVSTCKKLLSAGMISQLSTITNCPYANNQSNGDGKCIIISFTACGMISILHVNSFFILVPPVIPVTVTPTACPTQPNVSLCKGFYIICMIKTHFLTLRKLSVQYYKPMVLLFNISIIRVQ